MRFQKPILALASIAIFSLAACSGSNPTPGPSTTNPVPTAITVDPTTASVTVGGSATLTATVRDQNGQAMNVGATWAAPSSNLVTTTISGNSVVVKGVAAGSTTLTATSGTLTATVNVTVSAGSTLKATIRILDFSPATGSQILMVDDPNNPPHQPSGNFCAYFNNPPACFGMSVFVDNPTARDVSAWYNKGNGPKPLTTPNQPTGIVQAGFHATFDGMGLTGVLFGYFTAVVPSQVRVWLTEGTSLDSSGAVLAEDVRVLNYHK